MRLRSTTIGRELIAFSLSFLFFREFQGLPLPPERAGGTGERAPTAGHSRVAWQAVVAKDFIGLLIGQAAGGGLNWTW